MTVFDHYRAKAYPHQFRGTMRVAIIVGGIPTDPKVAEGWLRTKLAAKDDLIREQVAEAMLERGITADEAAKVVDQLKHLNGFKRDQNGLYIEGRQLKAALKEAANVAANAGKLPAGGWGSSENKNYRKGIKAWLPEHVFVLEDKLPLMRDGEHVTKADDVMQRFVHTGRGTGIQYEEYCTDVTIEFTIATDHAFTDEQWAMLWLTGEQQGIGATRSQGFGRYEITDWGPVAERALRAA